LRQGYVCGLCQPPSRAGKTRKASAARAAEAETGATGEAELAA
jgi:flagellar transcriptional activator FlhC